jgi:FkbM family methyltransferase
VSSFDRYLYLGLHRWRIMGRRDRKALMSLVRSGMRVVDVGANIGLYTLLFADLVGDGGRVFAFEPEPQLCELLRHNCMINSVQNVRIFECALGSVSGRSTLWRSAFNSGDNRLDSFSWTESGVDVPLTRHAAG